MTTSTAHARDEAAPQNADAPTRVLFLGGLGRSGTTVLERVLGELAGTCSVGEVVHLWQRGVLDDETCGCGQPFSACTFWTAVGQRAFGGWDRRRADRMRYLQHRVDRTRHVPLLALPRLPGRRAAELDEYVGTFARLYRAIAEVSGSPVVIDSSKHSSLAFCLRHATDVDLRVVHVVRDSRGVAYSWTKEVKRPESAAGGDLMTRYSPARCSALWLGHNLSFALLRRLGVRSEVLRYEDFVAAPRRTVAELGTFADVPAGDAADSFVDDRSVVLTPSHTVAGNPVRFRSGELTIRADEAWRQRLPRAGRLVVTLLTLPLLARYGYLTAPRSRTRP